MRSIHYFGNVIGGKDEKEIACNIKPKHNKLSKRIKQKERKADFTIVGGNDIW